MFRGFWKTIMYITLSMTMLTSCISCSSFWANIQTVGKGYQGKFEYKGTLEKKYAYDGEYQVELFTQEDRDERIKLLQVYYPANLKTEQTAGRLAAAGVPVVPSLTAAAELAYSSGTAR